jgi:hypothetical protein
VEPTDLAAENAALRYEIHRLRCQARRDTEALNDAEENARTYRRLAYRLAEKCNDLENRLSRLEQPEETP